MPYLNTGFAIVGFLVGAFLIYLALFMTESEERGVENILSEWWLVIKESQQKTQSGLTSFAKLVARQASAGLDSLFGQKLQAWKVLTGLIAIYLLPLCIYSLTLIFDIPGFEFQTLYMTGLGFMVAYGRIFGKEDRWGGFCHRLLLFAIAIGLSSGLVGIPIALLHQNRSDLYAWFNFYAVAAVVFASNLIFLAVTRLLLRWSSGLDSWFKISGTILANYALVGIFLGLPILLVQSPRMAPVLEKYNGHGAVLALIIANIPLSIPVVAFSLLALVMLAHRVFWPVLHRPIYALQRFGVFKHRTKCGSVGCVMVIAGLKGLGMAAPVVDLFKNLTEKIF